MCNYADINFCTTCLERPVLPRRRDGLPRQVLVLSLCSHAGPYIELEVPENSTEDREQEYDYVDTGVRG